MSGVEGITLPDYQGWLAKESWLINEAVSLINGEEPYGYIESFDHDGISNGQDEVAKDKTEFFMP